MTKESLVIRIYGNSPQMRIVDFLMEFPTNEFTKSEILENVGMSKTTISKYFDELVNQGLVKKTSKIGKSQLYSIDMKNPIIQTIKLGIGIASDEIADKQIQNKKLLNSIRYAGKVYERLKTRKMLLSKELKLTNESLKIAA